MADHFDVVVVGTGFGGTMTALTLLHRIQEATGHPPRVLMLERGVWWTTPVPTVQDHTVATKDFLERKNQPVQVWSSAEDLRGAIDILTRCVRQPGNEDGLYDFTHFGRKGALGIIDKENDGVSVVRASGVGGGSLVYSNITVRPPNFVLDAWPGLTWTPDERTKWFELAKDAIGYGVIHAWKEWKRGNIPYTQRVRFYPSNPPAPDEKDLPPPYAGLNNIAARAAGLEPGWNVHPPQDPDYLNVPSATLPANPRSLKQIAPPPGPNQPPAPPRNFWIDRARAFQLAVANMPETDRYGTVDSAIGDVSYPSHAAGGVDPFTAVIDPSKKAPINYCERQGRCNVGCLPGARNTLNKQLMAAALGRPADDTLRPSMEASKDPNDPQKQEKPASFAGFLEIRPLAEVDVIAALADPKKRYEVRYRQRDREDPSETTRTSVTAERVIVAAGCLGTNEILLRSQQEGTLPGLSSWLGKGFSMNGDTFAFLEGTDRPINLSRGPMQTSVAHFSERQNQDKFHTVEDLGIPRALAAIVGFGIPLIRRISESAEGLGLWVGLKWVLTRPKAWIDALERNSRERQQEFVSADEWTMRMMAVTASGLDEARGEFRLGTDPRDTPLRLSRRGDPQNQFYKDPIYEAIDKTLNGPQRDGTGGLAAQLIENQGAQPRKFVNPLLTPAADALAGASIPSTHPLGGCRIGTDAADGVVNEWGQVFDTRKPAGGVHPGLYVADATLMRGALGVNPSLTISTLALRIADRLAQDMLSL
jgi:choline dehydrogenase-like flavoprotein